MTLTTTPSMSAFASESAVNNRHQAQALIDAMAQPVLNHFINGKACGSADGRVFDNHCPVDSSLLNQTALGGAAEISAASSAAAASFEAWRHWPAGQRRDLLHAIADNIEKQAEKIALIETADTGQPLRFTGKTATRGAENFRYFADICGQASDGRCYPTPTHLNYTVRDPIGPVGAITPWNMPFMLATWKIAPALAAGCTVVHKPAEWSPLTATLLATLAHQAGLPAGVLNTVHGLGSEAGKALTQDPRVKAIGFVGGTVSGTKIMEQGAASLKRIHLELGGKSPVMVFADADLERALDAVSFMIFSLNGQRCNAGSRLLVQHSIHDTFVDRLVKRAQSIRVGNPFDPATEVGPLIHGQQLAKVQSHCERAVAAGATLRCGGPTLGDAVLSPGGHWFNPTIVTDVTSEMDITREEVFGPVLVVQPFDDEAHALALVNESRYGLSSYLWTRDLGRSHRMARSLQSGMVWVNTEISRNLAAPFGGMKDSGIGRDGGDWSFDFYMETRNVCIALGDHKMPSIGRS
jgi:5-carboxymethyl-2-hydroxymuconic-semialdehyde dehydrogenase